MDGGIEGDSVLDVLCGFAVIGAGFVAALLACGLVQLARGLAALFGVPL